MLYSLLFRRRGGRLDIPLAAKFPDRGSRFRNVLCVFRSLLVARAINPAGFKRQTVPIVRTRT
jgi:hypothetical protein